MRSLFAVRLFGSFEIEGSHRGSWNPIVAGENEIAHASRLPGPTDACHADHDAIVDRRLVIACGQRLNSSGNRESPSPVRGTPGRRAQLRSIVAPCVPRLALVMDYFGSRHISGIIGALYIAANAVAAAIVAAIDGPAAYRRRHVVAGDRGDQLDDVLERQ
jgi:hypothetical protein